jgi:hypothetical protein
MQPNSLIGASWITLALGIVLAVAAWPLGFPQGEPTVTALIGGVLIAALSIGALATHGRWQGWFNFLLLNLLLGAIVFIAPIVLRFDEKATMAGWTYVIVGLAVAIVSIAQLWRYTA